MNVKLISYSQAPELTGANDTPMDLIAYCARVSNPSNQMNTETNERLLKYLIKHQHWSPFEMVNMCLEIDTTRDIARQILRHRSFSFQEFSQRYANPQDMEDTFTTRECRLQDDTNRQNSIKTDDKILADEWEIRQQHIIDTAKEHYDWAIRHGIAKEQARALLPEGLTKSRLYMNGTLRSWIHYIDLRSKNGTQEEHMDIAKACAQVLAKLFPMITDYTEK